MAAYLLARTTAVSPEARAVRKSASAIVASRERSIALFGAKRMLIEQVWETAGECEEAGWNGEDALAVPDVVVDRAMRFVRALPESIPLPAVAPEPDGSLSFDWMMGRAQVFSVSIGMTDRLAYAWIDGTDRGHGVARFYDETVPVRVLDGIRELMHERTPALRTA
jgi:hypothetical protein